MKHSPIKFLLLSSSVFFANELNACDKVTNGSAAATIRRAAVESCGVEDAALARTIRIAPTPAEAYGVMNFTDLSSDEQRLVLEAEKVMVNAYDPSSHFYVGCAVLTQNGKVFLGANVNVCSYDGLCAEKVAIGSSIANREYLLSKIAIICKSHDFDVTVLSGPCGACRQFIWEFAELGGTDILILSSDTKKQKVLRTPISQLHPFSFGPRLCGLDILQYTSQSRSVA
jgi:cytidine deaminase